MNPRTRTLLVIALIIPILGLFLLAAVGSLRNDQEQRRREADQRKEESENTWWARVQSEAAAAHRTRLELLQSWPADAPSIAERRRAELAAKSGDPGGLFCTIVESAAGERIFPPRVEVRRLDDILATLDIATRQGLRVAWQALESGEEDVDAQLGDLALDPQRKEDVAATTQYFRATGYWARGAVEDAKNLDASIAADGIERLPTTLALNLQYRRALVQGEEDGGLSGVSADLVLSLEALAESRPILTEAWWGEGQQAGGAIPGEPSPALQNAIAGAFRRAALRRADAQGDRPRGEANEQGPLLYPLAGHPGFLHSDESSTVSLHAFGPTSSDFPSAPEGLSVRELKAEEEAGGRLVIPGESLGARRFDLSWTDRSTPTPWTIYGLIGISALALGGLIVGSVLTLRSLDRERELLDTRAEFLSAVSHQLKTPVANLRLFAETLSRGQVEESADQEKMLGILRSESEKLGDQLQRIMGVARLDAPLESAASSTSVSVGELLGRVEERWKDRIALEGGEIDSSSVSRDLCVVGDSELLTEALDNLVGNAVVHGAANRAIRLSTQRDGRHVRLRVEDQGPGIPESERGRIFDRFHRGEGSRKRRGEGTGLGLWIARRIAERYGGRLNLESTSTSGTVMRLDLVASVKGEESS